MCITPLHDRINLNLVGAPNCRGPLVLELTLTTVRYATGAVYLCEMKNLQNTHTLVYEEFLNGNFVVKRSQLKFSY